MLRTIRYTTSSSTTSYRECYRHSLSLYIEYASAALSGDDLCAWNPYTFALQEFVMLSRHLECPEVKKEEYICWDWLVHVPRYELIAHVSLTILLEVAYHIKHRICSQQLNQHTYVTPQHSICCMYYVNNIDSSSVDCGSVEAGFIPRYNPIECTFQQHWIRLVQHILHLHKAHSRLHYASLIYPSQRFYFF